MFFTQLNIYIFCFADIFKDKQTKTAYFYQMHNGLWKVI